MKKSVTVTAILAVTAMLCLACGSTTPIGPTDGGSGNCGAMTCASGQSCIENKVCVTTPTTEAEAFIPKAWPPAETKLDLSCFSTAPQPSAGPVLVSVHACLSTFGISLPTEDLEISYYDYAGGKIGSQIGVTVTAVKAVSRTCPNTGYYEIDNIPTNKLLVRKVACAADDATCKTKFHTTYQYNVFLDAGTAKNGVITDLDETDAEGNVVSDATWKLIAGTVGIQIASGHGVAAGRVRDCGKINQIEFANVGTTTKPKRLVYFDGKEGEPKPEGTGTKSSNPDVGRSSTNVDGIYALIDLAPGDVFVQALAKNGGEVISVGSFTGQIFPEALTVISFKGVRPVTK